VFSGGYPFWEATWNDGIAECCKTKKQSAKDQNTPFLRIFNQGM
jgi:hypothetical protein